jgi:hypothetical protein
MWIVLVVAVVVLRVGKIETDAVGKTVGMVVVDTVKVGGCGKCVKGLQ